MRRQNVSKRFGHSSIKGTSLAMMPSAAAWSRLAFPLLLWYAPGVRRQGKEPLCIRKEGCQVPRKKTPEQLDPLMVVNAYAQGIFPMAHGDGSIHWYAPDP